MRCSGSVRPFLVDLRDGTSVYLAPEQFALEPLDAGVHTAVGRDGWLVFATSERGVAEASFRVVDLRDGREVTRNHVRMDCSVSDLSRAPSDSASSEPPAYLPAGAVGRGETRGASAGRLTCTQAPAPITVWRYTAPYDGTFEFLLQGGFDTALEVRAAGDGGASLGCSDDDGVPTHSRVVGRLVAGRQYDLFVSGQAGASGRYEVAVIPIVPDVELRADRGR
jgi:outer membrane protein assembly factor BamB